MGLSLKMDERGTCQLEWVGVAHQGVVFSLRLVSVKVQVVDTSFWSVRVKKGGWCFLQVDACKLGDGYILLVCASKFGVIIGWSVQQYFDIIFVVFSLHGFTCTSGVPMCFLSGFLLNCFKLLHTNNNF